MRLDICEWSDSSLKTSDTICSTNLTRINLVIILWKWI